jgi:hypothetical protein
MQSKLKKSATNVSITSLFLCIQVEKYHKIETYFTMYNCPPLIEEYNLIASHNS